MKLWHDNERPAPKGWVWAKSNAKARAYLSDGEVKEISLDFDMGPQSGLILVLWMISQDLIPGAVTIHSMNEKGAELMHRALEDAGTQAKIRPYEGRYF